MAVPEPLSPEQRRNQDAYLATETVEFYETFRAGLFPCEQEVVDAVVAPGSRLLDLGVGAGRTSRYLAELVGVDRGIGSYVGLDYSARMVEAARVAAPDLEFVEGDAADLSAFGDGAFDVVLFSFNGIDCLHPDAQRLACLAEIHRVLDDGGTAILTTHNPQAFVARPRRWAGEPVDRKLKRLVLALRDSSIELVRAARTRRLAAVECYYDDVMHGGARLHAARPEAFIAEVERFGFRRTGELVGSDHPLPYRRFVTGWYVLAFRRMPVA